MCRHLPLSIHIIEDDPSDGLVIAADISQSHLANQPAFFHQGEAMLRHCRSVV